MRHRRRALLAVGIGIVFGVLAVVAIIVRYTRGPAVRVVIVQKQDLMRTIVATGRVLAAEEITVGAAGFALRGAASKSVRGGHPCLSQLSASRE